MKASEFLRLIDKPHAISRDTFYTLLHLADQYPYASLLHVLIAQGACESSDENSEHLLAKAAIYTCDRKKLYHIIHSSDKISSSAFLASTDFRIAEEFAYSARASTQMIDDFSEAAPNAEAPAEDLITSDMISISAASKAETSEDNTSWHHERKEDLALTQKSHQKLKHQSKKRKKSAHDTFSPHDTHTFYEWLKIVNKHKIKTQQAHESHIVTETLTPSPTTVSSVPDLPATWERTSDLPAEIRISDLAEKSIQKNEEYLTETFVKILELQKKYTQAIDAYEKLRLKYPEKSDYFAARIEQLKTKI